jgi:NAD(P)-dependent dehydrogenase (short-subunit alcohol dehydrogenase family)
MLDLTGRTVVVTGGNGGIGLGLARGVARAGARVAIWARDRDKTDAATKELGQLGAEAAGFACDVSREEDVARCLAETLERFGPVHAGFANAGFATSHERRLLDLLTARQSSRAARPIALRPSGSSTRA